MSYWNNRRARHDPGVIHAGCGGRILIDDLWPHSQGEWRFESFCETCKECDPNGWRTLSEATIESRTYFGAAVEAATQGKP